MKLPIITTLTLLSCSLQAANSTLQVRHRESGGVGYSQGYTSGDYFLTAQWTKLELLFNLRGHLFNDGFFAGNGGIGLRYSLKDDHYRLGANVFYDCRDSSHLFANQISAGLEFLSHHFDIRANGYLPIVKTTSFEEKKFQNFSGHYALIQGKLHAALPCIEGEVGIPFYKRWYVAVGTYYLFRESHRHLSTGNAWGAKLHADVSLGHYLGLGMALTHDHIFNTRLQGVVSLNIPLGKRTKKPYTSRDLGQVPIMRNEIIPLQTERKSRTLLTQSSSSNSPVRFLFVSNTAASGDGSFEKPFASLKEAEEHSKPGDVIYVFPGDGTPRHMDEGIVLKNDQILASAGAPLNVGEVNIPAATPGAAPAMTNVQSNQPVVTNPGRSRLNDFIFLPPWEYLLKGLNALITRPDPDTNREEPQSAPSSTPP
jgi:hypothetical protein